MNGSLLDLACTGATHTILITRLLFSKGETIKDMTDKHTLLPRLASVVNNRKNYVWGIALLASLFLAGSLMRSPQSQAKGAYSTPVTVMNTSANPANTLDADKASRIPYVSTVSFACG